MQLVDHLALAVAQSQRTWRTCRSHGSTVEFVKLEPASCCLGGRRAGCDRHQLGDVLLDHRTLGNTDRVSDVGVVSSSFALFWHLFRRGWRFVFLLSTLVLRRLSSSWTPESQHGFSQHTGENTPAMVDAIRLFDCLWPPPCCACELGQRVSRERALDTSLGLFVLWQGVLTR